ncbi:hypothetical protein MKY30_17160 [Oceanobacillus sp. FSL W8-0428]|uniref:hypothetical protein n=1 Tax=Oceanobacillus TaxID=182709 RepID=UPI000A532416|nr:hypothetical protein [Oceanobacillus sojae]
MKNKNEIMWPGLRLLVQSKTFLIEGPAGQNLGLRLLAARETLQTLIHFYFSKKDGLS